MRKLTFAWATVVLALAVGIVIMPGCSLLPKEEEELKPPLVPPVRERLQTAVAEHGKIEKNVKGIGYFSPANIAYHQFKAGSGRVHAVHVAPGDMVKKGDLLIQLDIEDLDIQLLQQEIDLEKAKARFLSSQREDDELSRRIGEAEWKMAHLKYERTKERLESRYLKAEMDGVVVFVEKLSPNDTVNNDRVLVSVADLGDIRLLYEPADPSSIKPVLFGMPVEIRYRDQFYQGKVVQTPSTAPSTDDPQLAEKYGKQLYIDFEEMPRDIQFGDPVELVILIEQRENALVIPRRGLRSYMGRNYVYVLQDESRLEIDVEIGLETATQVEIVEGLEAGQIVILQ